jgi:hypothetical protein
MVEVKRKGEWLEGYILL